MTKIFGIGLLRTGTLSLAAALQRLGYKTIHYPRLNQVFKLVEQYDAMTDTTVALNYIRLDRLYPESKFILTTRNFDEWLQSCKLFFSKQKSPTLTQQQIHIRKILYGAKYYNLHSRTKCNTWI